MIAGIASGAVVHRPVHSGSSAGTRTRADEQAAHERERQALQAADDRGRERVDDQQGERLDVEVASSSRGRCRRPRPSTSRAPTQNIDTRPGLDAVERRELAVVDDRAHRDAEACAGEQDLEDRARARGPTTMVMKRDHGMSVSPIWKPLVPKNRLMWRVSWGSQIRPARPMRASIKPMVVTIWATSGASAIARISTRSMSAPMIGAATNTVSSRATNVWIPTPPGAARTRRRGTCRSRPGRS